MYLTFLFHLAYAIVLTDLLIYAWTLLWIPFALSMERKFERGEAIDPVLLSGVPKFSGTIMGTASATVYSTMTYGFVIKYGIDSYWPYFLTTLVIAYFTQLSRTDRDGVTEVEGYTILFTMSGIVATWIFPSLLNNPVSQAIISSVGFISDVPLLSFLVGIWAAWKFGSVIISTIMAGGVGILAVFYWLMNKVRSSKS